MKTGDMVVQSEIVADWANNKRLAFIGDGDAVSVCVAYLKARNVLDFGPSKITVFDFDERTVQAVKRFAVRSVLSTSTPSYTIASMGFQTGRNTIAFTQILRGAHQTLAKASTCYRARH